ncbi:MAG: hydrogenase maturation protease [Gemmatimonadota bacterium]|nr:MAG: hydrogenase maturation protease [Gemmatimonadota bacterium]
MIAEQNRATVPDALAARLSGDVFVVGVGNPLLGDDAAGCLVARGLVGTPGLEVIQADEVPESHFGRILDAAPDVVVFVDAVDLGARPGSVAVLEAEALARYEPSTHRVPVGLVADLLRRQAGADVFVLAVQPRQVVLGSGLSPEVAAAIESVIELIRRSLSAGDVTGVAGTSPGREVVEC